MKGTVVGTWIRTLSRQYGSEKIYEKMAAAGIDPERPISPLDDIEDEKVYRLIDEVSKTFSIEKNQLWKEIGEDNVAAFYEGYGGFFRKNNMFQFLCSMNDVHQVVRKRIAGSNPPILDMLVQGKNEVHLLYKSERGMFSYLIGLLEGTKKHFEEDVRIEEISRDRKEMRIRLIFPYEVRRIETFRGSRLMSLGFIKDPSVKLGLMTLLLGIASALLLRLPRTAWIPLIVAAAAATVGLKILMRPMRAVDQAMDSLLDRNYVIDREIRSGGDACEQLYDKINRYKAAISEDFIGLSSMTQEMQGFSRSMAEISQKMDHTSLQIAHATEQLSRTSAVQAEETEQGVFLLQQSVSGIQRVSKEEKKNKNELEEAVGRIRESFEALDVTVGSLEEMLGKFEVIRGKSTELKDRGKEIEGIASLVSGISYQTNLLALNASIEAARAGETGRGFAVVAEEVRALAEQSEKAANNIKENVYGFLAQMDAVVEDINEQYRRVLMENESIRKAITATDDANKKITTVAEKMAETSEELEEQTEQMNRMFSNIESLASIAQENSASTEIVSSNVSSYASEIQNLTRSIADFERLTGEFKGYIDSFKL
ncbi:MAG: heme NO-binding domain-containing protein [Peptostreptococcaceae bacterium]|nr:heme NO-binding domain-containing protein [Peptostreptococcaceae bacterium]